jgi:riboflavin kinase/FMN adenylyltransferase
LGLLSSRFSIKKLVVGYNFKMGRGRDTGVQELVGILSGSDTDLEVVPATLYRQEVVSSSRIRDSIRQGRLDDVREMLQDDFRLDLQGIAVERRRGSSRVLRSHIEQVLPRIGEYQVRFISDNFECAGTLAVEEEQLRWRSGSAEPETEIRFVNRL